MNTQIRQTTLGVTHSLILRHADRGRLAYGLPGHHVPIGTCAARGVGRSTTARWIALAAAIESGEIESGWSAADLAGHARTIRAALAEVAS